MNEVVASAVSGRRLLGVAALLMALATIAGAFGAHALRAILSAAQLQTLQTGVHYQFFNALGLLALGLWLQLGRTPATAVARAGWLIAVGILIFSGSLYALALGAPSTVGAVTPIGGLCMIAGWLWVAFLFLRSGSGAEGAVAPR
jgi:uncharacterized membrane protein YgdD (TMEM256/DUF423 family)